MKRQGVFATDTLHFTLKMKKLYRYHFLISVLLILPTLLSACAGGQDSVAEEKLATPISDPGQTQMRIIAHRGARSLAPENTLAAAVKALEYGADGWELDVAMSADGVLVLLHDDTLERTSNAAQVFPDRRPWTVYDFSLDELRQLDFGSWFVQADPFEQAAEGKITAEELQSYAGLPITTLEEALQFTREHDWWVNIEIKDASDTAADAVIVPKVVELVEQLDMLDQVLISSFKHDYLRQVKSLNPDIATGVLVDKTEKDPLGLMQEYDAQAYHPKGTVINAEQVQALIAAGYDVNVWTVNKESDMRQLLAMGVSGIFTDFPQTLKPLVQP